MNRNKSLQERGVLAAMIGLTSAGCAGFDGARNGRGNDHSVDGRAAMEDQVNCSHDDFTDKNQPPIGPK